MADTKLSNNKLLKALKLLGKYLFDWTDNLVRYRIPLCLLIILAGMVFYAPPYTLIGVNGFSVNILKNTVAHPLIGKAIFYFAIAEFFGFSYFGDILLNWITKRHKTQKRSN